MQLLHQVLGCENGVEAELLLLLVLLGMLWCSGGPEDCGAPELGKLSLVTPPFLDRCYFHSTILRSEPIKYPWITSFEVEQIFWNWRG